MNAHELMDLLLKTGSEYVEKGIDIVEKKLDIPEDKNEREAMLSSAGKGALAAGAIAALLGTRVGRKLTGTTLKLGSLAAIGGLGYQAFKEWQKKNTSQAETAGEPVHELSDAAKEKRSISLLKAMVAAAQVDGHLDSTERGKIIAQIKALDLNSSTAKAIEDELSQEHNLNALARSADSPEAAAEMYMVSRVILDVNEVQERLYLKELADALGLEKDLVDSIELKLA